MTQGDGYMDHDEFWQKIQEATAGLNLAYLLLKHGGNFEKHEDTIIQGIESLEDLKREIARREAENAPI